MTAVCAVKMGNKLVTKRSSKSGQEHCFISEMYVFSVCVTSGLASLFCHMLFISVIIELLLYLIIYALIASFKTSEDKMDYGNQPLIHESFLSIWLAANAASFSHQSAKINTEALFAIIGNT